MDPGSDETVRLRAPRKGPGSLGAHVLPWVAGFALVAALSGGAWWALRPAPNAEHAPVTAPQAQPVQLAPWAAPPLASETEILADDSDHLAIYRFAPQPAVVVVQFPTLHAQALMLNRVAAFIEKAGFSHTHVPPQAELDAMIVASGGTPDTFYYGHDYRSTDLVRFLHVATDLSSSEQDVRDLVQKLGWEREGALGALISLVRRTSAPDFDEAARATILRHELSHGIYFTEPAYAAYCQRFWSDVLTGEERSRFSAFLDREGYDTALSDLLVNETQAYLMHTPDRRFFSAAAVRIAPARIAELRQIFLVGMPAGWLRDNTAAGQP